MERDWVLVYSTGQAYKATLLSEVFNDNNIICDIINKKDSSFLVGDIEVYVYKNDEEKALALVNKFND